MSARFVGNSLTAFGVASVLSSLVAAYFLDALTLDILAIVVAVLGSRVREGNRRAARWAVALMAYCVFVGALLLVAAVRQSENLRVGGRLVRPALMPWGLGVGVVVAVWAIANVAMLVVVRRRPAEGREGEADGTAAQREAAGGRAEVSPSRSRVGVGCVLLGAVLVGLGLFVHPGLLVLGAVLVGLGLVLKPPGTWGVP